MIRIVIRLYDPEALMRAYAAEHGLTVQTPLRPYGGAA